MPLRKVILATGEFYHVFNRSVHGIPIFRRKKDFEVFIEATNFYLQADPPTKFSLYRLNPQKFKLNFDNCLVTVLAFCIMPNHFHFILKQEKDEGITKFIQRLTNSFAHYFSKKYQVKGPIFEANFKAIRIETEEQLIHLSRYIHLNPVTAYLVEDPLAYPFSSYGSYLNKEKIDFVDKKTILSHFSFSTFRYKNFVMSYKEYQRDLEKIKHLILE